MLNDMVSTNQPCQYGEQEKRHSGKYRLVFNTYQVGILLSVCTAQKRLQPNVMPIFRHCISGKIEDNWRIPQESELKP